MAQADPENGKLALHRLPDDIKLEQVPPHAYFPRIRDRVIPAVKLGVDVAAPGQDDGVTAFYFRERACHA